jgi:hypothetical protein
MINKLVELNRKEVGTVSGGVMSDFAKSLEDTLCASSIYGAAVTATSLICPIILPQPVCAGATAVMAGVAFVAIPIIGEISKNIAAKNQTNTTKIS